MLPLAVFSGEPTVNCVYRADPDEFLLRESRIRADVHRRTAEVNRARIATLSRSAAPNGSTYAVEVSEIPVRNLIDNRIFGELAKAKIPSAPLSTDEEFLRRIMLDLNGRIPTPAEIREFTADSDPSKRDRIIDRLLFSPQFVDKWTQWLGDLLGNAATAQNINQGFEGRNRMHEWMRASIDEQKSLRDIATEAIIATGNNYDVPSAPTNFVLRGFVPMGPSGGEDHFDGTLVRVASTFLGLGHYDCLLCHDGGARLRPISAWGASTARADAQKMAAFFARTRWVRRNINDQSNFYFNSYDLLPNPTALYPLTSTAGNRPSRITKDPANPSRNLASYSAVYRDGKTPANGEWRDQFARFMIDDPMFARNLANRLWKAMFQSAFVEPVDALDPLRLDPNQEPPAPWGFQTEHVVLLDELATYLRNTDYNLREFLRLLASSSAYQLSSRYDADWNIEMVPLFPRHYPRRLEGEEVHDLLVRASGVIPRYTVNGWTEPTSWAMQLPEPVEPRSNGNAAAFMNSFNRGNRDTLQRSQSGTIQMRLNLMNNAFVTDRTRVTTAGLQDVAKLGDEAATEELYLKFLSRWPTPAEKAVVLKRLGATATAAARNTVIEDVAWALINKVEFLFSY